MAGLRTIRLMGLLWVIFSICFLKANAQAQSVQFSIFGGWNHVFKYGSEEDYKQGENDFPVTPAHTPVNFGMAASFFFTKNIGLELDGRYVFLSKMILQDPSDQDRVEIDTSKHYSITLNFVYHFLGSRFRPYILVGGGIDKLLAKEETYISEYGYEIEFSPPEKTMDAVANIGTGIRFFILSKLGIRLDLRYSLIFADPDNQNYLNLTAGLFFAF